MGTGTRKHVYKTKWLGTVVETKPWLETCHWHTCGAPLTLKKTDIKPQQFIDLKPKPHQTPTAPNSSAGSELFSCNDLFFSFIRFRGARLLKINEALDTLLSLFYTFVAVLQFQSRVIIQEVRPP